MRVSGIRKCVVFLGAQRQDGEFLIGGTAFYVGHGDPLSPTARLYLVTARHVLQKIGSLGLEHVCFRANSLTDDKVSAAWWRVPIAAWYTHPADDKVDVAILETRGLLLDFSVIPLDHLVTDEYLAATQVGAGDSVAIVGLFRSHPGIARNVPIVRTGNIACMDEEPVQTAHLGPINAYLIEARSIGGISGSPVFLCLPRVEPGGISTEQRLLGLIHGHFDVDPSKSANIEDITGQEARINVGIAIVVPAREIVSLMAMYEEQQHEPRPVSLESWRPTGS